MALLDAILVTNVFGCRLEREAYSNRAGLGPFQFNLRLKYDIITEIYLDNGSDPYFDQNVCPKGTLLDCQLLIAWARGRV